MRVILLAVIHAYMQCSLLFCIAWRSLYEPLAYCLAYSVAGLCTIEAKWCKWSCSTHSKLCKIYVHAFLLSGTLRGPVLVLQMSRGT